MKRNDSARRRFSASIDSSIKRRLLMCFLLIAFVMGIICLMVFVSNVLINKRYERIYDNNSLILDINSEVDSLVSATERFLSTKTTDSLEAAHECMNTLSILTYELKTVPPSSEINMMMRDIGGMTDFLMSHVNIALLAKINRNGEQYTGEFDRISRLSGYISTHCLRLNMLLMESNNQELNEYTEKQANFNIIIIVSFALVTVMCVLYIIYQSNAISKPIVQMAKSAREISEGNFSTPDIEIALPDETGLMAEAFNKMKSDVRNSIDRIERQRLLEVALKEEQMDNLRIQSLLRDAEYVALQSQIQPHFLFNTINAGLQIAYREGADETVEFLDNMSGLFRYSLRNMQEPVTLASETEQIERYLYILEKRFAGSFSFEIRHELPPELCRTVLMPLMVLQPIVENAYAHGIRSRSESGRIEVAERIINGRYAVTISDNGMGMSSRDVERLLRGERINESAEKAKSLGIGIANVNNRLKHFYERDDVLTVDSTLGVGTTVTVFLGEADNASFDS